MSSLLMNIFRELRFRELRARDQPLGVWNAVSQHREDMADVVDHRLRKIVEAMPGHLSTFLGFPIGGLARGIVHLQER